MTTVIFKTAEELRADRAELLSRAGMSYQELAECGREFVLNAEQYSIWETIKSIDFLLRND